MRKGTLGRLKELRLRPRRTDFLPPPPPTYSSEASRVASEVLETLWQRYEELTLAGEDTTAAMGEIVEAKRKLRAGPELEAGDILAGRYRLQEPLGRGGFATVWKAFDRRTHGLVAVKVLHGQFSKDATRLERFFRGARKMAELNHPGIVRVLESEGDDDGYRYFVMEYVPGGDLRQAVLEKRLGRQEAFAKVLEVGEALAAAHEQKLIHRDVKPANILLDASGRPKLTDFDLVRAFDTTGGTRTQAGLGTFLYTAPEVMAHASTAGVPADVYSLAMTAAFALHGEEIPHSVLRAHEPFLKSLACSPVILRALLKATSFKPGKRFASVPELLRALSSGAAREAGPDLDSSRASGGTRRRPSSVPAAPPPRDLVAWVEKEIPRTPKKRRAAAVLGGVEAGLPLSRRNLKGLGVLAWALDCFAGRQGSGGEREEANRLRERLAAPFREERSPPDAAGPEWVLVPSGRFQMGTPEGGYGGERPVHRVTVSSFRLLDHPVTNREYRALVPDHRGEDDFPAVEIDWYRAYAYCAWLGGRLPTEAEWEYACRAGTATAYWSGDGEEDLARVGWYDRNSGGLLHPVREKPANPWGLYDMHGNTWEWAADWYCAYKPTNQADPWGPAVGGWRVTRGGAFASGAEGARSTYRFAWIPWVGRDSQSFRVLLPVAPRS